MQTISDCLFEHVRVFLGSYAFFWNLGWCCLLSWWTSADFPCFPFGHFSSQSKNAFQHFFPFDYCFSVDFHSDWASPFFFQTSCSLNCMNFILVFAKGCGTGSRVMTPMHREHASRARSLDYNLDIIKSTITTLQFLMPNLWFIKSKPSSSEPT